MKSDVVSSVLIKYDPKANEAIVSNRTDIDKNPQFTRLVDKDGTPKVLLKVPSRNIRVMYTLAYEGDAETADRVAQSMRLMYEGAGVDRGYIERQKDEALVKDDDHVLAVYLNPKTQKVHIQSRDKNDPRWIVDLSNMTVTWPCDEEFAGTYHIVAYNLKKDEGEGRKRELYAVYQGMGYTKIKARNQVIKDVRQSRMIKEVI